MKRGVQSLLTRVARPKIMRTGKSWY